MTRHDEDSAPDLRRLLARVEAAPPADAVKVAEDELAAMVGAHTVCFLLADYSGRAVVRLRRSTRAGETVELAGTVYEQVLRSQQVDVRELDGGTRLTVPVTVRGDAIGVMELELASTPDERVLADVAAVGHALGYVVVANRRYTDLFEWGQRTAPFSLAAEIQRRLLPAAFTCEAGQLTVAGWLEPANAVGGDTFDYMLGRDTLHVSITDAVGHDVHAALLATVLVGGLRNGRRRGMGLGEQARTANDALAAYSPPGEFVTGQLLRVDLRTGAAGIVNAGHPLPLRLREGRVEVVALDIDIPFGLRPGREFRLQRMSLEPGDRILLVTDGLLERNSAHLDVREALRRTGDLHPREVVRAVGAEVLLATGGDLRDDATVVCLDWYGGSPRRGWQPAQTPGASGVTHGYRRPTLTVQRPARRWGADASPRWPPTHIGPGATAPAMITAPCRTPWRRTYACHAPVRLRRERPCVDVDARGTSG